MSTVVVLVALDARFHLGAGVLWALSLLGMVHMAGGLVDVGDGRTLYFAWIIPDLLRFDQIVHFWGSALATGVCWKILDHFVAGPPEAPDPVLLVIVAMAGTGVVAVEEVVEFVATRFFDWANVGGYVNTGWDLVFNLAGAVAASVWVARSARPGVGTS